jgi:hypothetical protein
MANLEEVDVTSSAFASNFASFPREIADMIMSLLLREPINIECNYLVPQTYWRDLFLQTPFLWDLDREVIASKVSAETLAGKEWNWEKLARQVLSPPKVALLLPLGPENNNVYVISHKAWNYKDVGLLAPDGLTNRRRIWQICEDMYPNDVGLEQPCPYLPPYGTRLDSDDEGSIPFDSDAEWTGSE